MAESVRNKLRPWARKGREFLRRAASFCRDENLRRKLLELIAKDTAELKQSERLYRTIAESSSTGIFITQEGKVRYANREFAKLLGLSPEKLRGKILSDLLAVEGGGGLARWLEEKARSGSGGAEVRVTTPDGKAVWLELRCSEIIHREAPALLVNAVQITQRMQRQEEMQARERALKAVNAAAIIAWESSELGEMLSRSLHETVLATDADAGVLYLTEERDENLSMVCQQGLPKGLVDETSRARAGDGLIGTFLDRKDAIAIPDLTKNILPFSQTCMKYGYRSFIGAPIASGENVLGVIGLLRGGGQAFTELDSHVLKAVVRVTATALAKIRGQEEIETALLSMRRLQSASCEPKAAENLDEALDRLAGVTCKAGLALSSMIALVNEQGRVAQRAVFGYPRQTLSSAISRMDTISTEVAQSGQLALFPHPSAISDSIGPELLEAGSASAICVPLSVAECRLGALWFSYETPRKFHAWEIEQLQALADRVATTIETSRLHTALVERIERYKALRRHCEEIGSSREPKEVLQNLADSARQLLGAKMAVASLSGEEFAEQAISTTRGTIVEDAELVSGLSPVESAARPLRTAKTGAPSPAKASPEGLVSVAVSADSASSAVKQATLKTARGSLTVPLVEEREKPAGFLMVSDKMGEEDFSEEDAELLDALGKHGMLALRNARAYKAAERVLHEHRAVLDGLPVAIATVNKERVITAVNKKFEELTGFARREVENKVSLCDIFPEAERQGSAAFWQGKAAGAELEEEAETLLLGKDGSQKRVKVSVTTVEDSGSIALCVSEVPRDDHAIRHAAETERATLNILPSLYLSFTAAMGRLENLLQQELPRETRQTLEDASEEIQACRRKIEDLKALARPAPLVTESVSINGLITKLVDEKAEELRRDNIRVMLQLDANMPPVVADAEQLRWVLGRLIENCRERMREAGGVRTVTIRTDRKGRTARAIVSDTRSGVSAEELRRLFQPPAEGGETQGEKDLSLAACRAIIERHGWQIAVEDNPYGGVSFVIEYPLAEEPAQQSQPQFVPATVETPPVERPSAVSATTALIIDNESVVIDLLDYYLRSEGHRVEISRDGRDARSKLKEKDYDLIFCDLQIPGLSGRDLFRWLEANKPRMARRVIFTVGDLSTPGTLAFLREGEKRWLEKPFELTELRRAISEALQGGQSQPPDTRSGENRPFTR